MTVEQADLMELEAKIENRMAYYEGEIRKIDIEIAVLREKRVCYSDAKAILWGLIN